MKKYNKYITFSQTLISWVSDNDPQYIVTDLLRCIKIPAKLNGYYYIRHCILMLMEKPATQNYTAGKLYREASDSFDVSAECVEHCIRRSFEKSWDSGKLNDICDMLSISRPMYTEKPSAYEFIADISNILRVYLNIGAGNRLNNN